MAVVIGNVLPLIALEALQPVKGLDNPHTRMVTEINAKIATGVEYRFASHSLTTQMPNAAVSVADVTDDKVNSTLQDKAE